jgi:hypothetical protein
VYDQPIFVAAEIKDDPIVAHEIYGTAELPLYGVARAFRLIRSALSPRKMR